ncbi:MAG TPA: ABC transporter permease [Pseudolysinimonas sp.]|nr:ABC transporter permease [Pseudolysinimonas sp.]
MRPALWGESLKLAASLVGRVATVAVVVGIVVLSSAMLVAARSGNTQVVAKLGPDGTPDWHGFLAAATQITAAGGLAGFAIVLAWMFGREFADGAVNGLFALPVSRRTIAAAKLLTFAAWGALVSAALPVVLGATGVALGLGTPGATELAGLARLTVLGLAGLVLATPVAWAATLGRSVLAGVGVGIGLIVVAQVSVLAGAGGWMPLAAPALWAMTAGRGATLGQVLLVLPFGAIWVVLTLGAWRRLQVR